MQWRVRYCLCYELAFVIPDFKRYNIIMSARVYFIKTVNGCKDVFTKIRFVISGLCCNPCMIDNVH